MDIKITVYKGSGKYYVDTIAHHDTDIPLYKDEFKQFIKANLPAHYSGGFVVVEDAGDDDNFHQALYRYDDL